MKFKRLSIKDIIEITPNNIIDNRGYFSETYRKDLLDNFIGKKINFCQENKSKSVKNVFRGLHYQLPPNDQTKLVSVIEGKIIDVVVDLRVNSKHLKNFYVLKFLMKIKNNYLYLLDSLMAFLYYQTLQLYPTKWILFITKSMREF